MEQYKKPFYDRFVNEVNFVNIEDHKKRSKFYFKTIFIGAFSFVPGFIATLFGYDFTYDINIIVFCFMIFYELIAVYCFISLYRLDSKYKVFRKKKYMWLFYMPYFVMSIAFCITANFTTTMHPVEGGFYVDFNPIYFFFLFTPLWILYMIPCWYCFLKCFAKNFKRMNFDDVPLE